MTRSVVYLHGFLSGPDSYKARILREKCRAIGWGFEAPDLNTDPESAARIAADCVERLKKNGPVFLVGASLGGFYATHASFVTGVPAVLVNPVACPWAIIDAYVGEQKLYGSEKTVVILPEYAQMLKRLDCDIGAVSDRLLVALCTGDEVLDWRASDKKYASCEKLVVNGSNHQMSDFPEHLPAMLEFFEKF